MSSLLVFKRVYRLEIQSARMVFSTEFVNYCPSILLSFSLISSPPPSVCELVTVYTRGGEYGVTGGEASENTENR